MKTFEEKTKCVFSRIEAEKAALAKRKRTMRHAAAPVLCLCLAAALGLSIRQAGLLQKSPEIAAPGVTSAPIPYPDGTIRYEEIPDVLPSHPILHPGDEGYVAPVPTPGLELPPESETAGVEAIATDDAAQFFCLFWWKNRLVMTGDLYWIIDEDPGAVLSVMAVCRPATANVTDFSYAGKTLAEWAIAADEAQLLPEKMGQLLKQGDELKYGAALWETGTPDGIRWDRALYEDRAAFFGDLLDRYIVDGEFLRSELEADLAALQSSGTAARDRYAQAYSAYLDTILPAAVSRMEEAGFACRRADGRADALIFSATAEQLEALPPEMLTDWYFSLAPGEGQDAAVPVTDDAGPQITG